MLEAKLAEAGTLKKLLDAIKELVTDANFECNEEGIHLQAMDNSHVALVAVKLLAHGFKRYRCDRPMPLGVNLTSLTKVLKCAKDDDICTLKAADEADVLNLVYEAKNSDRIAEYDMKLMDIDSDTLGIPDTEYDARVTMPSAEFTRIVRDLSQLGESVRIEVSKEGVRFASEGEAANGSVLLRQAEGSGITGGKIVAKKEDGAGDDEEEDDDDEAEGGSRKEKKPKVKKEKKDDDVEMDDEDKEGEEEAKNKSDDEGEEEQVEDEDEDEDEDGSSKKRKKKANGSSKPAKKAKTASKSKKGKSTEDDDVSGVTIEMNQHVSLTFSLKYLVNFSKSASLSPKVQLMMSNDVPLLVAYDYNVGHIHYYLAPKIGDD
ncbi:proliferating cell nuclear antigen, N-terminal domain-containing protein [Crassisporium funariophilum]|nr:proliferating cell nuclear antigen, N-terminal domain-containing protein [Crassisporium funariophilum]